MEDPGPELAARLRSQVAAARARIGTSFERLWLRGPADVDRIVPLPDEETDAPPPPGPS